MFVNGGPLMSKEHDLSLLVGRFTGRGATNGALAAVNDSNTKPICHGMTCSRTAAGVYLLTYSALAVPTNIAGGYAAVLSGTPNQAMAQPRAIVAGVSMSFSVYLPSTLAAYDPTASEELWVVIFGKVTGIP